MEVSISCHDGMTPSEANEAVISQKAYDEVAVTYGLIAVKKSERSAHDNAHIHKLNKETVALIGLRTYCPLPQMKGDDESGEEESHLLGDPIISLNERPNRPKNTDILERSWRTGTARISLTFSAMDHMTDEDKKEAN